MSEAVELLLIKLCFKLFSSAKECFPFPFRFWQLSWCEDIGVGVVDVELCKCEFVLVVVVVVLSTLVLLLLLLLFMILYCEWSFDTSDGNVAFSFWLSFVKSGDEWWLIRDFVAVAVVVNECFDLGCDVICVFDTEVVGVFVLVLLLLNNFLKF